jgi:hypothetical protein
LDKFKAQSTLLPLPLGEYPPQLEKNDFMKNISKFLSTIVLQNLKNCLMPQFLDPFFQKNIVFIFSKNLKKLSHSPIQERLIVVMPEANESVRRFFCGILELDYLI